tara:strand:+ start:198 stop:383 length:186 start_codon:yes stop_codon:yes gene_type:complete
MSFISYIAVDWGKSNPILPQRPILMTKTEAFKLNKQLLLNNENKRYVREELGLTLNNSNKK